MAFRGVDYMSFDSLLSEQELMVRQTARRFVDEQVLPLIRDCYRDARFPSELIRQIGELGFLGANLEGYGCAGMSNVEYGLIMQEIERGDSGLRSFVSVQGALVMYPIYTYGSEEQKQRWLPRLQSGRSRRLLRPDRAWLRIESRGHADHARNAMAVTGFSMARKPGSPTDRLPMSLLSGLAPRPAYKVFLSRKELPDTRRPTSMASFRCAPPSPPACLSQIAGFRTRTSCRPRKD